MKPVDVLFGVGGLAFVVVLLVVAGAGLPRVRGGTVSAPLRVRVGLAWRDLFVAYAIASFGDGWGPFLACLCWCVLALVDLLWGAP